MCDEMVMHKEEVVNILRHTQMAELTAELMLSRRLTLDFHYLTLTLDRWKKGSRCLIRTYVHYKLE